MDTFRNHQGRHRLEKGTQARRKWALSASTVVLAATGGLQLMNATTSSAIVDPNPLNPQVHIPLSKDASGRKVIYYHFDENVPQDVRSGTRQAFRSWGSRWGNPNIFQEVRQGGPIDYNVKMENLGHINGNKILGRAPYAGECPQSAHAGCLTMKLDPSIQGDRHKIEGVAGHETGHSFNLNHSLERLRADEIMPASYTGDSSTSPSNEEAELANRFNGGRLRDLGGNPPADNQPPDGDSSNAPQPPNFSSPDWEKRHDYVTNRKTGERWQIDHRDGDPVYSNERTGERWRMTSSGAEDLKRGANWKFDDNGNWYQVDSPALHEGRPKPEADPFYEIKRDSASAGTREAGQETGSKQSSSTGVVGEGAQGQQGHRDGGAGSGGVQVYGHGRDGSWRVVSPGSSLEGFDRFDGYSQGKDGSWQSMKDPGGYLQGQVKPGDGPQSAPAQSAPAGVHGQAGSPGSGAGGTAGGAAASHVPHTSGLNPVSPSQESGPAVNRGSGSHTDEGGSTLPAPDGSYGWHGKQDGWQGDWKYVDGKWQGSWTQPQSSRDHHAQQQGSDAPGQTTASAPAVTTGESHTAWGLTKAVVGDAAGAVSSGIASGLGQGGGDSAKTTSWDQVKSAGSDAAGGLTKAAVGDAAGAVSSGIASVPGQNNGDPAKTTAWDQVKSAGSDAVGDLPKAARGNEAGAVAAAMAPGLGQSARDVAAGWDRVKSAGSNTAWDQTKTTAGDAAGAVSSGIASVPGQNTGDLAKTTAWDQVKSAGSDAASGLTKAVVGDAAGAVSSGMASGLGQNTGDQAKAAVGDAAGAVSSGMASGLGQGGGDSAKTTAWDQVKTAGSETAGSAGTGNVTSVPDAAKTENSVLQTESNQTNWNNVFAGGGGTGQTSGTDMQQPQPQQQPAAETPPAAVVPAENQSDPAVTTPAPAPAGEAQAYAPTSTGDYSG
ncbi:hypothetical protein ABIE67_009834 [Streptomyces sp. V4I8]